MKAEALVFVLFFLMFASMIASFIYDSPGSSVKPCPKPSEVETLQQ